MAILKERDQRSKKCVMIRRTIKNRPKYPASFLAPPSTYFDLILNVDFRSLANIIIGEFCGLIKSFKTKSISRNRRIYRLDVNR
jgi:hypothetical protein